jgi:hypothetical protein
MEPLLDLGQIQLHLQFCLGLPLVVSDTQIQLAKVFHDGQQDIDLRFGLLLRVALFDHVLTDEVRSVGA